MLTLSLIVFAAIVLLLAAVAARGLFRIDDILKVVEPSDPEATAPRPFARAEK